MYSLNLKKITHTHCNIEIYIYAHTHTHTHTHLYIAAETKNINSLSAIIFICKSQKFCFLYINYIYN